MFRNVAYLGQIHEDIVDYSKPLIVTAAGNRRALTINLTPTRRPNGRSDYQLIYVASGKVVFSFHGKTQLVRKGHAVLFRPGDPQYYSLCKNNKPEIFWVHFTGSGVEEILDHYQIPKDENVFFVGTRTDYQWFFNRMITELQLKRVGFGDALTLNLQHIFLTINRYMLDHTDYSISQIANAVGYENSMYFSRIFKKHTGMSPSDYKKNIH